MRFEQREVGPEERRQWLVLLGSLSLAGLLLAGLHLAGVQLCLFRKYTGMPCFVCGSSRAAELLLRGSFTEAFRLQPLATLVMSLAALLALLQSLQLSMRRKIFSISFSRREKYAAFAIFTVLVLVNWIYLLLRM